jgi:ParB family chromosome partitioning protein
VADEAALAMALIENIQRENLNSGRGGRLVPAGEGVRAVAPGSRSGSRSISAAVSNLLRLLQLAKPVQALVADGALDMGHARAFFR